MHPMNHFQIMLTTRAKIGLDFLPTLILLRRKKVKSAPPHSNGFSKSNLYHDNNNDDTESETVYVREKVYVQPDPKGERILGRLSLIRTLTEDSLFLAWFPYAPPANATSTPSRSPSSSPRRPAPTHKGPVLEDSNFVMVSEEEHNPDPSKSARTLYAVHPIALSSIRAIRRHTPTIGWHHIILILHSGLTLPPLYFASGGVKQLLGVLRLHTCLVKSPQDPGTYLLNDTQDPLARSINILNLQEVGERAAWIGPPTPLPAPLSPLSYPHHGTPSRPPHSSAYLPSTSPASLSFSTSVLSRITTLACSTIMSASAMQAPTADAHHRARKSSEMTEEEDGEEISIEECGEGAAAGGTGAEGPLGMGVKRMSEPCLRILNGEEGPGTVCVRESALHASTSVGCFELLDGDGGDCRPLDQAAQDPALLPGWRSPPPPLSSEEWAAFLDAEGRVVDQQAVRARAFYGGVSPSARRELWPFLLGYMPWGSTAQDRRELRQTKREEYFTIKQQWQSISEEQASRCTKFRQRRSRIKKDVVRTDRLLPFYASEPGTSERNPNVDLLREILLTYATWNFDLAYCQGMNDLLSPLLFTLRDEAETFWCFVGLMNMMESNFHRDQNGMHAQLLSLSNLVQMLDPQLHHHLDSLDCLNFFFCYRWMLLSFKREFEYSRVLRLWDALWSRYPCPHFHLFVCVAILQRHRSVILQDIQDFDSLLMYISQLAGKIDLEAALRDGELLFQFAGEKGQLLLPTNGP